MLQAALARPILAVGLAVSAAAVATADPPRGYWVQSTGAYDRFPYPPAVGGQGQYWTGRPWVTFRDFTGSQVSMPLQPKVLYYDVPFATAGGYYYPRSITVIPDDKRRAVPAQLPANGLRSAPERIAPADRRAVAPERVRAMPTPTYRYDGGPAVPVPQAAPEPIPPAKGR